MSVYIHQLKHWPDFQWNNEEILPLLMEVKQRQAYLLGRMQGLGFQYREEANLDNLTLDVVKSSEIEGEILNADQVRSSLARRLGIDIPGMIPAERNVEGIVEIMLDATQHFEQPLTEDRLFGWQAALFPAGRSGMNKIVVGAWRDNPLHSPMQVISGMMGREKVHFQAPDATLVQDEMYAFLKWFNEADPVEPLLQSAIAHLWFITIHPFDDGNGRIARAITDLQLCRADKTMHRFYSMSAQIRKEKRKYYDMLEQTQKGDLNITAWLQWFLGCLNRALMFTDETLQGVLQKAKFWDRNAGMHFNTRQRFMLNKILDGYAGKITSFNWAKEVNCSTDTAVRDINELVKEGILQKGPEGGRSTNYIPVKLQ